MKHTPQIVLVTQGHGIGDGSDTGFDRSVSYEGPRMSIDLGKKG